MCAGCGARTCREYHVPAGELAHYSKATVDLMFRYPIGVEEIEGIANRTDFDLGSHTKDQEKLNLTARVKPNTDATERLSYFDHSTNKHMVPYVIEPSAGVDRGVLAVLCSAYEEQQLDKGDIRTVLHLKPALAPIKVAVLPLKKNHEGIVGMAKALKRNLQSHRRDALGLRRYRSDRQAVPSPGRGRDTVLYHGRFSIARRSNRDRA